MHSAESNMVVLDWTLGGRIACGERWDFTQYHSDLEVYLGNGLLLKDAVELSDNPVLTVRERMDPFEIFGLLILIGPKLAEFCSEISDSINSIKISGKRGEDQSFQCSVSPVKGGVVVRMASLKAEAMYKFVQQKLSWLGGALGCNIWALKTTFL